MYVAIDTRFPPLMVQLGIFPDQEPSGRQRRLYSHGSISPEQWKVTSVPTKRSLSVYMQPPSFSIGGIGGQVTVEMKSTV